MTKGTFIVIDGIDGVGKGVFLDEFVARTKQDGKRVFDINEFWKKHNTHPSFLDIHQKYDVLVTSEPTFVGIGKYIREELTSKSGKIYGPEAVMEAYALDRRILYEIILLPALENGIDVYQSRSFSSSIVYQLQMALDSGAGKSSEAGKNPKKLIQDILAIPGNAFCYAHPMDFLVIPTIHDVHEAVRRSESREKQDNSIFENLPFQLKLKAHYESEAFQQVFRKKSIPVTYLDAGKSIEYSQQQAREFYEKYLK